MPGVVSRHPTTIGDDVTPSPFDPVSWVRLVRPLTARTRFVELPVSLIHTLTTGTVRARGAIQPETSTWSDGSPIQSGADDSASTGEVRAVAEHDVSAGDAAATTLINAAVASEEEDAVTAMIDAAIADLHGAVCPKAGQKCPLDATWATFSGSTRCDTAADVLTLLQASERSTDALRSARGPCVVALRQWADLDKRMEFRAFVRDGLLIALCPRRSGRFLAEEERMDRVAETCSSWVENNVEPRVRSLFGPRYVVDFYVDREWRLWIVDFAEWGGRTDALLFDWEEFERAPWMVDGGRAQFRCSDEGRAVRPAEEMYHGLPLELRNPDSGAALAEAAREIYEREREAGDANEDIG